MNKAMVTHVAADLFPSMSDDEFQALKSDIAKHGQLEPITLCNNQILDGRHRYRACLELELEPRFEQFDEKDGPTTFVVSKNLNRRHLTAGQRAAVAVQADFMNEAEQNAKAHQLKALARATKTSVEKRKTPQTDNLSIQELIPECSTGSKSFQTSDRISVPTEANKNGAVSRTPAPQSRDEVASHFGTNPRYIQDAKAIRDAAPELLEQVKNGQRTLPQVKQELRRRQKRAALQANAALPTPADNAWTIHHGDCLEVLPTIESKARLVFADPPYNIGIDYGNGKSADQLPDELYLDWVEKWLILCRDRLTDDGSMWVLIGDEYAAEYGVLLKQLGLTIRSWITWFESFGVNCSQNFNRCSRHLFYCVLDPSHFVFNEDAVTRLSDRQTKYGDKRAAAGGKLWDSVWGIEPPIPRLTGTSHERMPDFPTQLPLKLITPIVQCATHPNDLVIDPFNGSGSTGVAAITSGRRYIGIERSETFTDLARLRLKGVAHE